MISTRQTWRAVAPLAIGGIIGFGATALPGCSDQSYEGCDCAAPPPATYVLESGYQEPPKDFPPLIGARFTIHDYEWQAAYDPDVPNAVLSYVDNGDSVIIQLSYAQPEYAEGEPTEMDGTAGQGGMGNNGP